MGILHARLERKREDSGRKGECTPNTGSKEEERADDQKQNILWCLQPAFGRNIVQGPYPKIWSQEEDLPVKRKGIFI